MAYYIDVFSPETYREFITPEPKTISVFTKSQWRAPATDVKPGDKFLCYLTELARWFGFFEIKDGPFEGAITADYPMPRGYVIHFQLKNIVLLNLEHAVPIRTEDLFNQLQIGGLNDNPNAWIGYVRNALRQIPDGDGNIIESYLRDQSRRKIVYPLDMDEARLMTPPFSNRRPRTAH